MFLGLVDTREPEREPLVLDLPELRPWRWFVAAIVLFVVAGVTGDWPSVVASMAGLGCAFHGLSTYARGNDGLSKYRQ